MTKDDFELADELFRIVIGESLTEKQLDNCENALQHKDKVIKDLQKTIEMLNSEIESQGEYIEDLEDENFELSQENKELKELLELERAKQNKETIELSVSIDKCYDVLVSVYNVLKVVDGLNKQEVANLKAILAECIE